MRGRGQEAIDECILNCKLIELGWGTPNRAFRQAAATHPVPVRLALERADGGVSRFDTVVAAADRPEAAGNFFVIERLVKFLLWSRGGWKA